MKNNNKTTFIIVSGILVLVVFTFVATINILPKITSSDSYFVKVEDDMSAKVEALEIKNGKMTVITSGDAIEFCVKSTKSTPTDNALCWKKIENNKATISVYDYEKYYIWIKDTEGKVSSPMSVNTNDN